MARALSRHRVAHRLPQSQIASIESLRCGVIPEMPKVLSGIFEI
jgi:hypothetical protein